MTQYDTILTVFRIFAIIMGAYGLLICTGVCSISEIDVSWLCGCLFMALALLLSTVTQVAYIKYRLNELEEKYGRDNE